jgi:hypothetical protein
MGSKFYKSNQTSWKTNNKQIHFGSYKLCNQIIEVKALITNIAIVTVRFMYEYILTKFGCPFTIVIDQEVHFINDTIKTSNKTIFVKTC